MIAALMAMSMLVEAPAPEQPDLLAANFFSHFCGPCLVLDIRLEPILPDYADASIEFVRLNQTFGQGRAQSTAATYGISDIYEQTGGSSGFILLIDQSTGEILDTITITHDEAEIRQRLDRALYFSGR